MNLLNFFNKKTWTKSILRAHFRTENGSEHDRILYTGNVSYSMFDFYEWVEKERTIIETTFSVPCLIISCDFIR